MKTFKAIDLWLEYHKLHPKKNTTRAYESTMLRFRENFGERDLDSLISEEVLSFLPGSPKAGDS